MGLSQDIKVLLIEDNLAEARLLKEILKGNEKKEFHLVNVSRLSEAISLLQQTNFDVILLDLTLPDSQGLESLAPLLITAPKLPIVVLTNTNDDNLALAALRQGAQDYLIKREVSLEILTRSLCYAIERKQMEEALRESNEALKMSVIERTNQLEKAQELNQLKTEFVSMLSHDFRNPLNKILLSAGLLEESRDRLTKDQQVSYFRMIRSAIKDMDQLLTEVLLIGRADSGRLYCQFDLVDLLDYCQKLVESFTVKPEPQLAIIFQIEGSLERGLWDINLIKHILTNLLGNALKYSPQGNPVEFKIIVESEQVVFKIVDRGIGIPSKDQEHLFKPFYRGSNVDNIQGTGLGLAIVGRCVEAHKGQIHLESEEGKGTKITVILPIITDIEHLN
ncbi:MAG: hybrid sensor histidine kinase/response regulator [Microcystis wesenbergii TW10]|jgi:signal transduction histidine kinase|uniref:histidine kinase n=4 Tax=Microcystis TaxID=1125 RepID=A0A0A1W147_MICAE|nr:MULTISPECIES: hybrid sensor histidine kinase/response regulator [Microcystis]REJ51492.1 MAG: hybrid sensor histidine kinase/response regulator [Microcystis wesenbergii TW10]REJ59319.1 MAG: hybrid sensor histidine kinase/response regulator [Microcystis aeruginosa TA09]TRT89087.1 MAG: hybrid sensor histidine kinase/response regulator [Microcystis aeruginosa Ma_OC_H_19870700_S124]MBD2118803.1 hybrid sensor histidine kinase/response regulator [Microcystis wesenbergii FACHB-1339]MCZ8038458.1 hyb